MILNKETHVYCTNCRHFKLDDESLPYCCYEDKCDINSCEDSKSLKHRPYYEGMFCYICNTNMTFLEQVVLDMLGKCDRYKCPKCGEVIYQPLSRF